MELWHVARPSVACAAPTQGTGDNGNVMGYLYQDNVNSSLGHTATYAYDSLNRLSTAVAMGNSYNLTFSYDRYGNMTCAINGSTQGLCPQYSFNQSTNQISNSGFSYDAAGDLTSDGSYSYQWDAEGRLGTIVYYNAFTYDALGQRVASLGGLQYLHDPSGKIIGHYSSGGYWYQSFPVAGAAPRMVLARGHLLLSPGIA